MDIIKRMLKRKSSAIGMVILIVFLFTALVGPSLCTQDPQAIDPVHMYNTPSSSHWFGTDYLGRDTFTRIVYGARVSLAISFVGVICGSFLGILLGVLAGYFGGAVDSVISRVLDIVLAFPGLLLGITIVAILGTGTVNTTIAVAIFSVPGMARIVRGIVMGIRDSEYVQACYVMGESHARILLTHSIPNSISQIIVTITLDFGAAILTSSSLSFLGLGVQPPNPEWGAMLSSARDVFRTFPLASIIPGLAITAVVLSFSLVGDGLRDALDPKLKYKY
jgi:peptide/nickel transport system permease protein